MQIWKNISSMFKVWKKYNPFNYIQPYFDSLISILFKNKGGQARVEWVTKSRTFAASIQPGYS